MTLNKDAKEWTPSDDTFLWNSVRRGVPYAQIARSLRLTVDQVRGRCRRLGAGFYRYTAPEVRERIVYLAKLGKSDREIGREVNVHPTTVGRTRRASGIMVSNPQKRAADARYSETNIIPSERKILRAVSDGWVLVSDVARKLNMTTSAVRQSLWRLKKKGLVLAEGKTGPGACKWASIGWWLANNQGLVWRVANQVHRKSLHLELDDIYSHVMLEVAKCVRFHKVNKGKFCTYSIGVAKRATSVWAAKERAKGVKLPDHLGWDGYTRVTVGLLESMKIEDGDDFPVYDREDRSPPMDPLFWEKATRCLYPVERKVVLAHDRDGKPFHEIGPLLGVTRQWAQHVHARALERIRNCGALDDYDI